MLDRRVTVVACHRGRRDSNRKRDTWCRCFAGSRRANSLDQPRAADPPEETWFRPPYSELHGAARQLSRRAATLRIGRASLPFGGQQKVRRLARLRQHTRILFSARRLISPRFFLAGVLEAKVSPAHREVLATEENAGNRKCCQKFRVDVGSKVDARFFRAADRHAQYFGPRDGRQSPMIRQRAFLRASVCRIASRAIVRPKFVS